MEAGEAAPSGGTVNRVPLPVMAITKRFWASLLVLAVTATGLYPAETARAVGTIDSTASALQVALGIATDPTVVVGASWVTRPPNGRPSALSSLPLGGFPRQDVTYAMMSSGDVLSAPNANSVGNTSADLGGTQQRGNTDFDVTVLRIDLNVPSSVNCLLGVDFRFLSEEFPEYVGSRYNDGFVAEIDQSTWTTSGSTITAPRNFAFDPSGNVISINSTGATAMSGAGSEGTTYDGGTPILSAAAPLSPGLHSLFLSIFDQGDRVYDSTVLIDNLRLGRVNDVATQCKPGAISSNAPRPLLGAHGITGKASDMEFALGIARSLVPGVKTRSLDTTANRSVFVNGDLIVEDARTEVGLAGRRANLLAHSKGGLDSRYAMWTHPELFNMLGMLATPNGGSRAADELCIVRQIPWAGGQLQKQFGPCDDPAVDGAFSITTFFMNEFNKKVRDWNYLNYYVAAGDCTGFLQISCNAATTFLTLCDRGDTAVCVDSAFALDARKNRGIHIGLSPVFDANHTEMRSKPCPASRVVLELYPGRNVNNPWSTSTKGSGCKDLSPAPPVAAFQASQAPAAATAATPPPVLQQLLHLAVSSTPTRVTITPDGTAVDIAVFAPPGSSVTASLEQNSTAIPAIVQATPVFDGDLVAIHADLTSTAPLTLVLNAPQTTEVGVGVHGPDTGVTMSAVASATSSTTATITATVKGLLPPQLRDSTVSALAVGPTGPQTVTLAKVSGPTGPEKTSVFTGQLQVRPGVVTAVDVRLRGASTRETFTSIETSDAKASFGTVGMTRLVDENADGKPDTLLVDVNVNVTTPDTYHVSVDFTTATGTVLFSAPGEANLAVGAGIITLRAPLLAPMTAGVNGPYLLRRAVLTRGVAWNLSATADSLGTTGPVDLGTISVADVAVRRPVLSAVDSNRDARLDTLRIATTIVPPAPGQYRVEGQLTGPDGGIVKPIDVLVDLVAGPNPFSLVVEGQPIIDAGSGVFALSALNVSAANNENISGSSVATTIIVDTTAWTSAPTIGGLIERWNAASRSGEITSRGFYTSELNRLERVAAAIAAGNLTTARSELDTFIAHVEDRAPKPITDAAAAEIGAYARAVRATL